MASPASQMGVSSKMPMPMGVKSVAAANPSLWKELKPGKSTMVAAFFGLLVLGGLIGLTVWMVLRSKKTAAESRNPCTVSTQCLPGKCYHLTDTHQEGRCYGVTEKPAVGVAL